MKNSFKRFLSLALALFMVISVMPVSTVFAAETDGANAAGLAGGNGDAYTGQQTIWGQANVDASESMKLELYSGDVLIATTVLVEKTPVLTGEAKDVTWNFYLNEEAEAADGYWDTTWEEGYPNIYMQPDKVVLYLDGEKADEDSVQLNAPDNLNKIVAWAEGYTGGVQAYTSLKDAIGKFNGRVVNVLRDVSESIDGFYGATLTTNVEGGVTITDTNAEDWIGFDDVTVGNGVTVNIANVYSGDSENVIMGTLNVGETYYHGYDAKTTIQDGGKVTVGDSVILRYNESADAGIYIYGDGDDSTVEFDCDYYIGAYSGTFYAEDANIDCGYFLLKNSYDDSSYANIDMILDNSSLKVVGTGDGQDSFIIDDQASLTLTNGASIEDVREFNILTGANLSLSVDETSSIGATNVSIADDVALGYEIAEDGTVTFNKILLGEGTDSDPILINDLEDLILFRDEVNAGNNYSGKYVKLTADIDLANNEWKPIGTSSAPFNGTFDGDNHKISNLLITGNSSDAGFFGRTNNGEIKNLTINNAKVSGYLNVGAVVGTPFTAKYTNIKLTGHVEVNGYAYVGGVGGRNAYANWTDITVDVDETSYVKADSENYRTYVGGVIGFSGEGGHTFKNISSNIKVIGSTRDIGGMFGIAHYGNKFENVTFTGSVEAPEGAKEVGGIAGVWHNQAGQTVTFTDVTSSGTVTVGEEDVSAACGVVGGAYNASNDTPANSGSLIVDGNKVWPVVAMIGDVEYGSLQAAIDAVKDGETIILQCDVTLAETLSIPANAVVDLDLNGKTLTGSILAPDAVLSIRNGSIVNTNSAVSALEINAGELTLTNVNIDSARHAVRIDGAVTGTINGGTYRCAIGTGTGTYHAVNVSGAADVSILDGTFVGPKGTTADSGSAVNAQAGATVSIIDGNFSGGKNATVTAKGTLTISGGTFDQAVNEAYCAESYIPTQLSDGVYSVKAAQEAWIIRNGMPKYYATLAEAVADAKAGETVMLCANVVVAELITIDKDLTIADYGQLTVTFYGPGAIYVTDENALTLDKVVVSEAKIYGDNAEAGASVNGNVITGIASQPSILESDGTNVTVANPEWVAKNGNAYYMTIAEAIKAAAAGDTVTIFAGEYTGDVSINKAIAVVGEGEVIINGKLSVTADGVTVKNLTVKNPSGNAGYISAKDVLIEGCDISGSNGFRYCYTSGTVTFKDSTITGSTYGIHFDGNAGGNIVIDNCEITGWTSFASTIQKVTITDTDFLKGSQNQLRFYQDVTMTGCTFNPDMTIDFGKNEVSADFASCSVTDGSSLLDVIYLPDLAQMGVEVTIDEEPVIVVAMIGSNCYLSIDEAFAAAKDGDTITLYADATMQKTYDVKDMTLTIAGTGKLDVNDKLTVHGESTLNISCPMASNQVLLGDGAIVKDSTINGSVFVYGNVTFRGENTVAMLYDFGTLTDNYGSEAPMEWTVEKGASLTITDKARYGLGYGDKITIYGSLEDALSARENLSEDDIAFFTHGIVAQESTGWNCNSSMTVEDAYVIIGSNNSFGNKPGNYGGNYIFSFKNAVVDGSRITFYEALSTTEFTFDSSDIEIGTFMTRDADSVFTLTNSVLLSTTTFNGTDEGNYHAGKLILTDSGLTYSAPLVMEGGVIEMDLDSLITASSITGTGKIIVDATGFNSANGVKVIDADMSGFTGTIEVKGAVYTVDENGLIIEAAAASIDETCYATLAEAVEAAQNGDTIKLLANGDLILANKAMTIIKNGYTVTVAALNGYMVVETADAYIVKSTSDVPGDTGEANAYIDADGDGYIDEELMTLQAALDAALAGQTVCLVDDLVIDGSITIPSDITLNLEGHTLTVNSLVGLSGSKLAGNPYDVDGTYGKLVVKSENFVLPEASYVDALGYNVIPVYNKDHYVFSRMQVNTDQSKEPDRGLVINEEDKTIYFQFVTNMTGDVRKNLLNDGAEDNEIEIIIRLEWQSESGVAHQDFVYKSEFVEKVCAGGYDFSFTLVGYDALSIDLETLTVKGMVITESGAAVSGTEWPN